MDVMVLESGTIVELGVDDARRVNIKNHQPLNMGFGAVLRPRSVSYVGEKEFLSASDHSHSIIFKSGLELNVPELIALKLKNRVGKDYVFELNNQKINCAHVIMVTPTDKEKSRLLKDQEKKERALAREIKKQKAAEAKEKAARAKKEAEKLEQASDDLNKPESLVFPKE